MSAKTSQLFRKYHRLLGFFLAGIMSVYALSGVLLIFRTTDFLKYEHVFNKQLSPALNALEVTGKIKIKGLKVIKENDESITLSHGVYNKQTGQAELSVMQYPVVLKKLVDMHKATTNSPLFFMNIFFGISLLFFAVSAFFMFLPTSRIFKSGLRFAGAGAIFAALVVVFS